MSIIQLPYMEFLSSAFLWRQLKNFKVVLKMPQNCFFSTANNFQISKRTNNFQKNFWIKFFVHTVFLDEQKLDLFSVSLDKFVQKLSRRSPLLNGMFMSALIKYYLLNFQNKKNHINCLPKIKILIIFIICLIHGKDLVIQIPYMKNHRS